MKKLPLYTNVISEKRKNLSFILFFIETIRGISERSGDGA